MVNSQRNGTIQSYMRMLASPFHREFACRYPDETIVPTSLAHFLGTQTYTVSSTANVYTNLSVNLSAGTGSILNPTGFTAGALVAPVTTTYGSPQTTFGNFCGSNRTLACGLRVRVVGLPTSTFLPAGTLYFLQIEPLTSEGNSAAYVNAVSGEQQAINAVLAGKGFSVTVQELVNTDGVHIPFLPRGPGSFTFGDYNSADTSTGQLTAEPILLCVGYGLQAGEVLKFDYTHHEEYVPIPGAAGLTSPEVSAPDVMARDAIHQGAAKLNQVIAGATTLHQLNPLLALSSSLPGTSSMATARAPSYLTAVKSVVADFLGGAAGQLAHDFGGSMASRIGSGMRFMPLRKL